jgi:hypothetical protein
MCAVCYMRKFFPSFAALTLLTAAALHAQQISVGPAGTGILDFGTADSVTNATSGWRTVSVAGVDTDATDAQALAAAVTNLAASAINALLQSSSTISPAPAQYATARYNRANLNIQTRPSGNECTLLMATLRNDTSGPLNAVLVTYDYGAIIANDGSIPGEEIPGYLTFFSVTGEANSWILIPQLSVNGNTPIDALNAVLVFPAPVPAGADFYILWADDNGSGGGDTASTREMAYTIDNLSVVPAVSTRLTLTPNLDNTITISWNPAGGTLQESTTLQSNSWTDSPNQANGTPRAIPASPKFYRVLLP